MRIIAGTAKRCRLDTPAGLHTRPTTDGVRGAAMSQLGGFFTGGAILDLCAGSGAVALEFLSRGCTAAVAIDNDAAAVACMRANAERSRLGPRLRICQAEVLVELAQLVATHQRFEYVWLDPPWDSPVYAEVLQVLAAGQLVTQGGDLFVESRKSLPASLYEAHWQLCDARRYGAGWLQRLEPKRE